MQCKASGVVSIYVGVGVVSIYDVYTAVAPACGWEVFLIQHVEASAKQGAIYLLLLHERSQNR